MLLETKPHSTFLFHHTPHTLAFILKLFPLSTRWLQPLQTSHPCFGQKYERRRKREGETSKSGKQIFPETLKKKLFFFNKRNIFIWSIGA